MSRNRRGPVTLVQLAHLASANGFERSSKDETWGQHLRSQIFCKC